MTFTKSPAPLTSSPFIFQTKRASSSKSPGDLAPTAGAAEIRGRRQAIVPATDDDRVVFSRHPPEYSRGRIRQLSLDNGSPQVQISPQALPNSQTRDKGGVSIGGIRDVG